MDIIPPMVVDLLSAKSGRKSRNGRDGRYVQLPRVCCGVYDPDSDGLKVTNAPKGRILAYCFQTNLKGIENFKHCAEGIRKYYGVEIETFGLVATASDLNLNGGQRPSGDEPYTNGVGSQKEKAAPELESKGHGEQKESAELRNRNPQNGKGLKLPKGSVPVGEVQCWDYQAADGRQVYVYRQNFQRQNGKAGKLIWREPAGIHSAGILVRLYSDDGLSPVILCEGEKSAEAVAKAGFVAASYCGGSGAALKANYEGLYGREVIIWPDDDQPGLKAASDAGLALLDRAFSIHMVAVKGLKDGNDAADCSEEELASRIAAAEPWTPPELADLTDSRYDAPLLYIEKDEIGLGQVLEALKLELRLNARTMAPEIQRRDYDTPEGEAWYKAYGIYPVPKDGWTAFNDYLRDSLKTAIERRARFVPGGQKAEYRDWQKVENAYVATRRTDPVREWMEALPLWDGVPRVEELFVQAMGAEDTDFNRAVAKAFMVGAVARTMEPGCEHQFIPVLIGEQGCGKSTFAKCLVPREHRHTWFSDQTDFSETAHRQAEGVGTALIVEFAELKGLSSARIEVAKTYISRSVDHLRLSYRRNAEILPRHWVGIATANPSEGGILPGDASGNRRFCSIPVDPRGAAAVTAYMDENLEQLWAEALELYREGEKNFLSESFSETQSEVNIVYQQSNEVMDSQIAAFLEYLTENDRVNGVELLEIAQRAEIVESSKRGEFALSPHRQHLLADTLRKFGWVNRQISVMKNGDRKRIRHWFPPPREN